MPIFVVEESNDIQSLMKKSSAFGMGGWWLGGSHMKPNDNFLRDLGKKVPKDANVSAAVLALDAGTVIFTKQCREAMPSRMLPCPIGMDFSLREAASAYIMLRMATLP